MAINNIVPAVSEVASPVVQAPAEPVITEVASATAAPKPKRKTTPKVAA